MERYLEFILNHYLLALGLAVVTFLLIQELIEGFLRNFEFISPTLAVVKMNTTETTVIDVRDSPDFITGHIEAALNLPLDKLPEQLTTLSKSQPIIVACQNGTRSAPACKILTKNGFSQVFCLTGGMQSWEENKLPIKITRKNKG
ncbi:MAG: rhodanese-like domain-containing protein [Methylococcaceae bacterium]|nr:rhodanese-like domain-containing protein [Methylococcaceae bacterium]